MILIKKSVFITGAGSGLGKLAAIALARRGHKVYATTHYQNQVDDLNNISTKEGLNLESFKLDILIDNDRNIIKNYDIDVLICNAAIGDSGSVADIYVDRIEQVFNTNVFCNLRVIQLALENMIKIKKKGRIVFLSSLAGRISFPFLSPYCASKFALESFASSLNKEMKNLKDAKIDIVILEPGAYATGFNKENNEKKYEWMYEHSYFSNLADKLRKKEEIKWNLIEVKPFNSIIKKYIKAVESNKPKLRYSATWWQALGVQLARIFGK